MSNFFEDVVKDLEKLETDLLGPNYEYWNWIKSPQEQGMSESGSLGALGNDIIGLVEYIETLVAGGGAQKGNLYGQGADDPLGDRYFLKTGATCTDVNTNEKVTRYIYVDNIPNGDIPFISSALDTNFSAIEGIIPGVMSSTVNINPFQIFQAFMEGTDPSCALVTLPVRDTLNNVSYDTKHITYSDVKRVEPCLFAGATNPISGARRSGCGALSGAGRCMGCVREEGFDNNKEDIINKKILENKLEMEKCDRMIKLFFHISLIILAIFITYKIISKKHK